MIGLDSTWTSKASGRQTEKRIVNIRKITFLEHSFLRNKSVVYKKIPDTRKNHDVCTLLEVVAVQFYYIHSSKIANQWPLFGVI